MTERLRSVEYERPPIDPCLIFVCGASATGKTTLVDYAVGLFNHHGVGAKRPVGYTTRPMRCHEKPGVDYHFVTDESFATSYASQIERNPEEWDIDAIGEYVYFCRLDDTVPDDRHPVSMLPISLELCGEMVRKYRDRYPHLVIRMITFALDETNLQEWERRMAEIRPTRDRVCERKLNDTFTIPAEVPSEIIVPTWNIETDKLQFIASLLRGFEDDYAQNYTRHQ